MKIKVICLIALIFMMIEYQKIIPEESTANNKFQEVENFMDWIEWCKEINGSQITFYRNGSIVCNNGGENGTEK